MSCAADLILFKIVNIYEIMYRICVIWITRNRNVQNEIKAFLIHVIQN